ncbi:flagellar hook-length control protein FliK [Hoeflea sp. AS16]|uniref:flagellar hook-length control protein FliK n=1 Tax=Hoeflea sp. AS16 TaxID=3135779 RepID=UPI00316B676C
MSALDMVLQRQVPARPVARIGEGAAGADAAGDNRNDAFSAALSQEKRSATAERDRVGSNSETDTGAETTEPDDQLASNSGQSDEVLNLLSGLMSSAAYSDDADLGKNSQTEEIATEDAVDADVAEETPAGKPAVVAVANMPAMTETDDVSEAGLQAAGAKSAKAQTETAAANLLQQAANTQKSADAQKAAAVQASGTQAGQQADVDARSSVAAPAALASAAAAGSAGQGTQAQAKAPAAEPGSDRQKDQSAIKEAMRALGMDGEARPAEDVRIRGRNAGRQGEAADRRSDEAMNPKGGKVEVIESRRFMPVQNMSANAQLLTRTLVDAGNTALTAQRTAPAQPLAQTGAPQAGQTLHTLKLQLNPVSLGSVTAVLKLSGDDLSVEIKVQTAEAYRQIKQDNESIIKALRGQGFGVEQITVQHVTGSDRASNQTAQQGFQPNQQGPGSSDAQSSGSENGRNNARQQGSGTQGGQGHDQGSYAGPGTGRTDGVYL